MISITKKKWPVISVSILEEEARKYKFSVCEGVRLCSFREAGWCGGEGTDLQTQAAWAGVPAPLHPVTLSQSLNFPVNCKQHLPSKWARLSLLCESSRGEECGCAPREMPPLTCSQRLLLGLCCCVLIKDLVGHLFFVAIFLCTYRKRGSKAELGSVYALESDLGVLGGLRYILYPL